MGHFLINTKDVFFVSVTEKTAGFPSTDIQEVR